MQSTAPATTTPTTLLLVPDHRLLEIHGAPFDWNFVEVRDKLAFVYNDRGPQDIHLYLVLPDVTMREVDFAELLYFVNTFSESYGFNVELAMYVRPNFGSFPSPLVPRAQVTRINSDKSPIRRLTVHLATKEIFDYFDRSWHIMLDYLRIQVKAPIRDNGDTKLVPLLQSGFRHKGNPSNIYVLMPTEQGRHFQVFPAAGRATVS